MSVPTPSICTGLCLLHHLQPVRRCLHPFLSARDAMCLLQASQSVSAAVLADYAFVDHVFTLSSAQHAASFLDRCARFRMRILRMSLTADFNQPLLDSRTGRSLLPPSLLALTLGTAVNDEYIAYAALDGRDHSACEQWEDTETEKRFIRHTARWEKENRWETWNAAQYGTSNGDFGQLLSPGALPRGLRFLQFHNGYNQSLQPGSIPDTVEVLQFGDGFNKPLETGHLPASLTYLNLGLSHNHPLLPGVLPAGLRRLQLGGQYKQVIQPGVLPPQLQQLSFGWCYSWPLHSGIIPSSVTHLRLSEFFEHPLQPGSIPHGVVHLNLSVRSDLPLLPGILPSSLRELVIGEHFSQPLQPGSLPDGLELIAFHPNTQFQHPLLPGVIPASVVAVSMGEYKHELMAGSIPSTVRWLRLPDAFATKDLMGVLSPATRVVWWTGDQG